MSLDEIKELDALVGKISFKRPKIVVEDEPKPRKTRAQMKDGESRNCKINALVREGIRERFREFIMSHINKGAELSYAQVRYEAADWRYNGERVSLTVLHELISEMELEGLIVKELNKNSFYLKPCRRGGLDELYAPILKSSAKPYVVQAELCVGHGMSAQTGKVNRGYSSYWEAAAWPSPAGW